MEPERSYAGKGTQRARAAPQDSEPISKVGPCAAVHKTWPLFRSPARKERLLLCSQAPPRPLDPPQQGPAQSSRHISRMTKKDLLNVTGR